MEAKIKSIKTVLPDNMQEVTLLELEEGCTAGEAFNVLMSYPKLKAFKIAGVEYKRTQVGRLSGGDRLGHRPVGDVIPPAFRHFEAVRAENNRRRNIEEARRQLDQLAGPAPIPPVWYTEEHVHAETNPTAPRTQGIYEQYINNPYRTARHTAPEYTTAMEWLIRDNPNWVTF